MSKERCSTVQGCHISALNLRAHPASPIKHLSRPHPQTTSNDLTIHVTPLELTILTLSLLVLILMTIWVTIALCEFIYRVWRGKIFEGDGKEYLEVEGRRYRQDMLMGGEHAVHRLARRGIVEKLGFWGGRRGGVWRG